MSAKPASYPHFHRHYYYYYYYYISSDRATHRAVEMWITRSTQLPPRFNSSRSFFLGKKERTKEKPRFEPHNTMLIGNYHGNCKVTFSMS